MLSAILLYLELNHTRTCFQFYIDVVYHFHGNLRMPGHKFTQIDKRTSDSLVSCFLGRKENTVSRGMFTIS